MEFPIAIHKDDGSVYGVTVPDVPGCFSWGETIDDAIRNAKEAIKGHIETSLEYSEDVTFSCSDIEDLAKREEFAGAVWALADVDVTKLDSKPERINVSFPRFVLHKIDAYVEKRHETRSGFLARVALEALAHEA
ncbi:type II toxin-antitoxin system HicB family antitoxin [Pandoraea apista]|uniref:HicB family protein n=1 Tax=Pandoraea apista TaxID=93218 RepID=A0A5E5P9T0_9BURK|nr:type II toxin-antitoxin system HicB family antitoxin [Pandoraea apista]ALS63682.1 HicB family protein [Pandoraea apista]OXS92606.1 HicB family protein [Pandoraea apista]PTE00898.1 type II toxin-antitoxin system HicB family antitoxin [Pandoraea apista]RRJ30860.1 type II toxin-antitoxin system HicB family antitoxin [Pandoraea apista]RRJ74513.1 type II toxin-antitoxin system HicB family antitoxin [Pandoraea apista]